MYKLLHYNIYKCMYNIIYTYNIYIYTHILCAYSFEKNNQRLVSGFYYLIFNHWHCHLGFLRRIGVNEQDQQLGSTNLLSI